MIVTARKDGTYVRCGFSQWGKPTLHVLDEKIPVETVNEIYEVLEARGYSNVSVSGWVDSDRNVVA